MLSRPPLSFAMLHQLLRRERQIGGQRSSVASISSSVTMSFNPSEHNR